MTGVDLPGLPHRATDAWLRKHVPELRGHGPWEGDLISGGLSNLTYRLALPGGPVILRRPPLGPTLPGAHDMAREFRVISGLAPTAVPVPAALGFCDDPGVIGAPFYVMKEVPGRVLRTAADTGALTAEQRAEVSAAMIGALVDLHQVEPDDIGLGDFGRHGGYGARQIKTWGTQWSRSRTRDLPAMDQLLALLAETVPAQGRTSIVHGDYRLDNAIMDIDAGPVRVAAVLDWELSTLGDPLADLALTMTYWHDRGDEERGRVPVAAHVTTAAGFATSAEIAERYAELSTADLTELPFYLALSAMKLAVILEGVHARYLGGQTIGEGYESAGRAVPVLVERGLSLVRSTR
jgi:aminoglycoside phosphotransferase (APT) family kinase protein